MTLGSWLFLWGYLIDFKLIDSQCRPAKISEIIRLANLYCSIITLVDRA